jgi:hypothetical protein
MPWIGTGQLLRVAAGTCQIDTEAKRNRIGAELHTIYVSNSLELQFFVIGYPIAKTYTSNMELPL